MIYALLRSEEYPICEFLWWLKVLGISGASPLFAGHLWYVRMLMVFIIFAAPIAIVLKWSHMTVPLLAIIVHIVFGRSAYWSSFFWFALGGLIALHNGKLLQNLRLPMKPWGVCLLGGGVIIALVRTFAVKGALNFGTSFDCFMRVSEFIYVLLMIPFVWIAYDKFSRWFVIFKEWSYIA